MSTFISLESVSLLFEDYTHSLAVTNKKHYYYIAIKRLFLLGASTQLLFFASGADTNYILSRDSFSCLLIFNRIIILSLFFDLHDDFHQLSGYVIPSKVSYNIFFWILFNFYIHLWHFIFVFEYSTKRKIKFWRQWINWSFLHICFKAVRFRFSKKDSHGAYKIKKR